MTEGNGRGGVAAREDLVVIRDSHCEVFGNFESLSNGFTPYCLLEDLLGTIKFILMIQEKEREQNKFSISYQQRLHTQRTLRLRQQ